MHTSRRARSWVRLTEVWSRSGTCDTIPSALPRGTIVALCTGMVPSVFTATRAWPDSWYAVSLRFSSLITIVLRSAPITIRSLANSRASVSTTSFPTLAAWQAAVFTRLNRSAPENPTVVRASVSTSTPFPSGLPSRYSCRISWRPRMSGTGTTTLRSNRPGRVRARSSVSGRLVAAITMMPWLSSNPSISTSSWLRVFLLWCSPQALRLPPIASISSMNTMQGVFFFAAEKRLRTRRAPTPTNISSNSLPDR
mmetsp:Transcript_20752/g.58399  ORF Transcript_20752/g.58399 Transcript_20752/m.58399 type:complete len:253 (-) Transcript_20752:547-1305(-)